MSGPIRFTWRDVDLAALRLERVAGLDLRQLSGFSMGALELNVSADLQLRWSLVTKTTDFRIWRGPSDQASKIESIGFSSTGSIDPVSGKLVLKKVEWSGGGLSVVSSLGASVQDGMLVMEDLSASGQIQAKILNQQLPELRALLGPEAQIGGRFAFDLEWHGGQFTDIKLRFNGNDLAITDSNLFNKRAGGPLSLQLDINGKSGQGRGLKLDNATITVGPMTFTAGGYVPEFVPGTGLEYYLKALASNSQLWANLKVTDLAGLGEMFGPLGDALAAGQLSGPAEVGFTYQGQVNRAAFKLVLDDQAVVDLEPYFKKQSGQKVELQLHIDLPPEAGGGLANMEFTGTIGQARFGTDGQSAKLHWAINPAGAGWLVDLSADLPVRLQAVDVLLGCLPRLEKLNLDRRLTGDLYLRARSNLQVQLGQGKWRISAMRSGVQVDASLAAINWQPQFVKQLDKVLLVDLDHRLLQAGLAYQARQAGRQELTIGAQLGGVHVSSGARADRASVVRAVSV